MQRNDPDLVRHYCLYTKSVCDVILNQIRPKQCDLLNFLLYLKYTNTIIFIIIGIGVNRS